MGNNMVKNNKNLESENHRCTTCEEIIQPDADVCPKCGVIQKKKQKTQSKITEIKCTCNECSKIWHHLGEKTVCCGGPTGCCGATMPRDKVINFDQCPGCGSRNIKKEEITYEVPPA